MLNVKRNRNLRRRTANAGAALLMAVVIVTGAAGQTTFADELNVGTTAGVVSNLHAITASALTEISVSEDEVAVVATGAEEEAAEEVVDEETEKWNKTLTPDVDEYLSVRTDATTEAELVGKLYRGSVAEITGEKDGWYEISSGNVQGFVSGEFSLVGEEAKTLLDEITVTYAVSTTDGLRVRAEANADSEILVVLNTDERIEVNKDAEETDGWVAVTTGNRTGYVSAEYVTVETEYPEAITLEEEQAILAELAAQQAAQAKAAAATTARSTNNSVSTGSTNKAITPVQKAAVAASYDDVTYLAAIIQHEAGYNNYDGEVAVGSVVVNRMRDGRFPSTVYDVINQPNQFISTESASMQEILSNGPAESCMAAAQQALSGYDNTDGALSFRAAWTGHEGTNIGGNVFF